MKILNGDHWLFVCAANIVRSPTAEMVARRMGCFASSCGSRGRSTISGGLVVMPLEWRLLEWADVIVCMEQDQYIAVLELMKAKGKAGDWKPIHCWDLPDIGWHPYDEELVQICEARLLESLQKHDAIRDKGRTPPS